MSNNSFPEFIRRSAEQHRAEVPEHVWQRISSRLDGQEEASQQGVQRRQSSHRTLRNRRSTLFSIAASLLVLLLAAATWFVQDLNFYSHTDDILSGSYEGPLQLDSKPGRPLNSELYAGVRLRENTLGTEALKVCSPC